MTPSPAPAEPARILHVLDSLALGGTELVSATLIERTAGCFEHSLCSLSGAGPPAPRLASVRVPTTFLAKRRGHDWSLALRVARLCRRLRPHVVHARNWGTMDAVIGARLARVPVVIHSEHGRDLTDLDGQRRARLRVRRLLAPWIDMHVTVSADLQRWLLQSVGVRPEKVRVVPNGVDTAHFAPRRDRDRWRRQQGYAPSDLVFGAVGRLTPVKDYPTLLEAFGQLLPQAPHAQLVVVGDGPQRPALEADLRRRGLAGRVRLVGFSDDVVSWLSGMDVFVHPSLMEGMSNSVLEAMAVGLPVVTTAVGGTPEIVAHGVTGLLVAPASPAALREAMHAYATQPAMRTAHAAAGRERVASRYPLRNTIDGYTAVYRDALARRGAIARG
ncbi:MAG: glycosyltransferase [Deltaproteobacteria bacterium]|nr:glycosyltransferase [Deltaproteobacteria bacterium]